MESKRLRLNRILMTPNGEELIKILAEDFDGSCYCKGDSHHTAYLEGRRDVITYLREVREDARIPSTRSNRTGSTGSIPRTRTRSGSGPSAE